MAYEPYQNGRPFNATAPQKMSAAAKALLAALVSLAVTVTGAAAAIAGDALMHYTPGFGTPSVSSSTPSESTSSGGDQTPAVRPEHNPNAPKLSLQPAGTEEEALTEKEIAEKVRPSVVGIVTYSAESTTEMLMYGEGSGVVLTADGYILTNAHVVDSDEDVKIMVVDYEGNCYNAVVVGSDARTDLAAVRITEDVTLQPAEFGNSESVAVGDAVLAIGNPGGMSYAGSVTYGRVSAVDRVIDTTVNVFGLFQVDAAINPGNSGGALVNRWGQVIGINCAKIVAQGYENMGFAIPISKAKPVFDTLMEHGYMKDRIRLGITFVAVDPVTAAYEGVPQGMRIVSVLDDGVFAESDVQAGDIIVELNGVKIKDTGLWFEMLYNCKPRDLATFTIYRPAATEKDEGTTFTVTVPLLGENE